MPKQAAASEGIYKGICTAYPNYAITGTTAEERLRTTKASVDPNRVMDKAGGFVSA